MKPEPLTVYDLLTIAILVALFVGPLYIAFHFIWKYW